MIKVKTFTCPLRFFHAREELENLDKAVNQFVEENKVEQIFSVSDAPTTDNSGATIGLIRVVAYK
jgi:hypothetical protein